MAEDLRELERAREAAVQRGFRVLEEQHATDGLTRLDRLHFS